MIESTVICTETFPISAFEAVVALYRRLSTTKGSGTAVKVVARKLGVLFYTPVKNKIAYDPLIAAEQIKKVA
jgi:hypothetical protein